MSRSNRLAGLLPLLLWGYFPFLAAGALLLLALIGLLLSTCWGTFLVPVILAAIIVGMPVNLGPGADATSNSLLAVKPHLNV